MPKENSRSNIEKLAKRLSSNHLHLSLENDFSIQKKVKKILIPGLSRSELAEHTVIFVVGAGASVKAGLPLAEDAIEQLKGSLSIPSDILTFELDRLESVYRLKRSAFETNLLALSLHSGPKLRDELQKMYSYKYIPLMCYEMISHLFKHRFIDAIINFNFDELLDQALEDELGRDEYYRIVSDGDCPEMLLNPEQLERNSFRSDLPVYIKPHGTASHKSTLRFTRDDYFGLPTDIRKVLNNLLVIPKRPLTIVSIGFGMQSFEFNHIIKAVEKRSEIFYLDIRKPEPEPGLDNYDEFPIKITNKRNLDMCLRKIWDSVFSLFQEEYRPRETHRHVLLTEVFSGLRYSKTNRTGELITYLKDRTLFELILSIAKAKGLINMTELSENRCGKYYELYRNTALSIGHTYDNLSKTCRDLGFVDVEYGHELYASQLKAPSVSSPYTSDQLILTEGEFKSWIDGIFSIVDKIKGKYGEALKKTEFKKSLISLFGPEDTEIKINRNNRFNKIFAKPKILKTKTALQWATHEMLKMNWNRLLIVAETGQWLISKHIKRIISERMKTLNSPVHIVLIVADKRDEEIIRSDLEQLGAKIDIFILNWWEHNRHMTISLDKNWTIRSIYFTRRLRNPDITPILLKGDDSKIVLKIFCAYYEKATNKVQRELNYNQLQDPQVYMENVIFNRKTEQL